MTLSFPDYFLLGYCSKTYDVCSDIQQSNIIGMLIIRHLYHWQKLSDGEKITHQVSGYKKFLRFR